MSFSQAHETFKTEQERVKEEARLKLGPFYLFPALNMNLGYDNNIYRHNVKSDRIADYGTRFSPEINTYIVSLNSFIFSITESPEYVYYFEVENERGWNNRFSLVGKSLLFNRFVLSGAYSNNYVKQRASSEFDIPTYVRHESIGGRLFYETFRGTSIGISLTKRNISYEDINQPEGEIVYSTALNRMVKDGSIELYYKLFSDSQFFVRVRYAEYIFSNLETQFRNSNSYEVHTGIHFPILGRVRGALSFGYKKLIPKTEEVKGYSGPVGDTAIDIRLRKFNFRLSYYRDVPFSFGGTAYFIENRYGAGISYYLTKSIRLNYDFIYGASDYPEEKTIELPSNRSEAIIRARTYFVHRVGLAYRIYENIGMGVSVNAWHRLENITDEETERLFINLYLTYNF